MAALHHDDPGAGFGIVHSGRHNHVKPIYGGFADRIGLGFLHVVRIVANDPVAALARGGSTH